jgi:hypothetical protein
VSKLAIGSSSPTTTNISSAITGCGTSALRDNKLVYQISMETTLNEFDLGLMNNVGSISGHTINYYELAQEQISGNFYASETDFSSYGKIHIFDSQNNELSNFDAGVSPGTIVFDIRSMSAGVDELMQPISIYPNPASSYILVENSNGSEINVTDLSGKIVISTNDSNINISNLNSGTYLINANNRIQKFVKL